MHRAQFISGNPVAKGRKALEPLVVVNRYFEFALYIAGFGCVVTAICIFIYLLQLE